MAQMSFKASMAESKWKVRTCDLSADINVLPSLGCLEGSSPLKWIVDRTWATWGTYSAVGHLHFL